MAHYYKIRAKLVYLDGSSKSVTISPFKQSNIDTMEANGVDYSIKPWAELRCNWIGTVGIEDDGDYFYIIKTTDDILKGQMQEEYTEDEIAENIKKWEIK